MAVIRAVAIVLATDAMNHIAVNVAAALTISIDDIFAIGSGTFVLRKILSINFTQVQNQTRLHSGLEEPRIGT